MRAFGLLALLFGLAVIAVPASATVHQVSMDNFMFTPSSLQAAVGDSVVWTNNQAGVIHTVTSGTSCTPNNLFDSGNLNPGQKFTHVFTSAGTFNYFCTFHCLSNNMVGVVIVSPTANDKQTWGKIKTLYR